MHTSKIDALMDDMVDDYIEEMGKEDHVIAMGYALMAMKASEDNRMNFIDFYGRYHDKPCIDEEPKSNNGWIYSAYADLVGLPVKRNKLYDCFVKCRPNYPHTFPLNRTPSRPLPPMSRDELLGMDYFNLFYTVELRDMEYWQFCNLAGFEARPLWKANWLGILWCLLKIGFAQLVMKCWWNDGNEDEAPEWFRTTAHRNVVWSSKYKSLWPLAFRLMPQDTWYLQKRGGHKTSWLHDKYAWWSMERTIKRGDASGILIVWMKLNALNLKKHPLYKKIDIKKTMGEYFTYPDHPILKKVLSGE